MTLWISRNTRFKIYVTREKKLRHDRRRKIACPSAIYASEATPIKFSFHGWIHRNFFISLAALTNEFRMVFRTVSPATCTRTLYSVLSAHCFHSRVEWIFRISVAKGNRFTANPFIIVSHFKRFSTIFSLESRPIFQPQNTFLSTINNK